jgi:hypothetical protein
MPRNREEEAGVLYVEGAKAVRAGGHELSMLTGHLRHMLVGTVNYPGALWQVRRVPPEGLLVEAFKDYLLLPARRGLGLPSLHFLRQALNAMPDGHETLQLVREQFTRELMNFDALADLDQKGLQRKRRQSKQAQTAKAVDAEDKANVRPAGRPKKNLDTPKSDVKVFPDGNKAAYALRRLRNARPDLHARVLSGVLSANAAMIEAGFRKPAKSRALTALDRLRTAWRKATPAEREAFLNEVQDASPP